MNYKDLKHQIQDFYKQFIPFERALSLLEEHITSQYALMQTFDRDHLAHLSEQIQDFLESVDEAPLHELIALLEDVQDFHLALVHQRQAMKKPLSCQLPKVDGAFKQVTIPLEKVKHRCEQVVIMHLEQDPQGFLNHDGKVEVEKGSLSITEGPKTRTFTISNHQDIDPRFLVLNEQAVKEYIDTMGSLPKGVSVSWKRTWNVKHKKTSSQESTPGTSPINNTKRFENDGTFQPKH